MDRQRTTDSALTNKRVDSSADSPTICIASTVAELDRNIIQISINGRKTHALVDTGANISCISEPLLHKLNISAPFEQSRIQQVVGVGGEVHAVLGQVTLCFSIGGVQLSQKFHVFKHLQYSCILGEDFLSNHNISINIRKRTLTIHDGIAQVFLI